ncbi:MAG: exodeoxyribonuclease 7 small subunit [marine bacterium B5-7]|nr:MAG: exodeoxyribonuclease 7 small subunit [marine bacterium B5-7]
MTGRKTKSPIADFEKRFAELEKIVNRMESGEQSLDGSLADFEKGMALCQVLRQALGEAEEKIRILIDQDDDARPRVFEPPSDDD